MTKVIVVNGPNLGRLGVRQPDVYGRQDLDTLRKLCTEWGKDLGLEVEVRQTDDEAEMVHWMVPPERGAGEPPSRRRENPGGHEPRRLHALFVCSRRRRAHGH